MVEEALKLDWLREFLGFGTLNRDMYGADAREAGFLVELSLTAHRIVRGDDTEEK